MRGRRAFWLCSDCCGGPRFVGRRGTCGPRSADGVCETVNSERIAKKASSDSESGSKIPTRRAGSRQKADLCPRAPLSGLTRSL